MGKLHQDKKKIARQFTAVIKLLYSLTIDDHY